MTEMTSRERMLEAINREPLDRMLRKRTNRTIHAMYDRTVYMA